MKIRLAKVGRDARCGKQIQSQNLEDQCICDEARPSAILRVGKKFDGSRLKPSKEREIERQEPLTRIQPTTQAGFHFSFWIMIPSEPDYY
jgi:hypothetical protein